MRTLWLAALVIAWTTTVTAASPPPERIAAFELAAGMSAPPGYVAYSIRLWGAHVSGRFREVSLDDYGQLRMRAEAGDDGHVGAVTVDRAVQSVVFLPRTFKPSAELLALRVRRPGDFHFTAEAPAPFTLRLLGDDPADPAYRLYETYFPGKVVTGTLAEFKLNDAAIKQGYPYRGPLSFRGVTKRRPSRFPGEKSVVRIPAGEPIPEILLYRR